MCTGNRISYLAYDNLIKDNLSSEAHELRTAYSPLAAPLRYFN